ncbi:MAG: bifunctional glutamate N-acetyltransferase/amino-acid acetyltransferase ArgJ [Saccharospirillaceae bacterium]|nr:bifunctional glutamate N-acetyltransferase/amino-acid acetyltransferase ArgJ [Pseudomonadales bacterium]NRB78204.1 bifunctional glutamate N-acetyltransferase/amino-acid acetyltransferase ArgJ [Saccharospirillaceae bacterium]
MAIGKGLIDPVEAIAGVKFCVSQAGVKYEKRDDFVVIALADSTKTAGVFTKNRFCAAPVHVAKQHLSQTNPKYLVINTGNANAGTGKQGLIDANQTCQMLAEHLGCKKEEVIPFSTGVIGEYLAMDKIESAINTLPQTKDFNDDYARASSGIMTTDTRPKATTVSVEIDGEIVTISGMTKGSGMIKPNMGTMLSFIQTDADLSAIDLQVLLLKVTNQSFNRITVDSDTSTNDACLLSATAQSKVKITESNINQFEKALIEIMQTLAHEMVRDGEGASKFIEIKVKNAVSNEDALSIAYSVGHSPLVKTAISASDANWGRILMAVGKAPASQLDVDQVDVYLDDVCIVQNGEKHPDYTEEKGAAVFAKEEFSIIVDLKLGSSEECIWTCDLSYEYIRINAEYRS